MKFKDREGLYQSKDRNIRVTVTKNDEKNLKIDVYGVNGITVNGETFDIPSAVTTGNFNIQSKNKDYTYILNFYNNTSLYFSVREGPNHKISEKELNNTKKN